MRTASRSNRFWKRFTLKNRSLKNKGNMNDNFTRLKKSIVLFCNAYGLKEFYLLLKYYRFSLTGSGKKPMLISMVDNRRKGKGLTDRFKGIVSVYALSKIEKVPYRCIYNHPCQLTDFLEPNEYNWIPVTESWVRPSWMSDSNYYGNSARSGDC